MFSAIEGWSFGTGLYWVYVSILTLVSHFIAFLFPKMTASKGYGDFAPITPAGRVVFIVYARALFPFASISR